MKPIYLTIMIIIFISEIALDIIALDDMGELDKSYNDEVSNFGDGLSALLFVIIIYPFLFFFITYINFFMRRE